MDGGRSGSLGLLAGVALNSFFRVDISGIVS